LREGLGSVTRPSLDRLPLELAGNERLAPRTIPTQRRARDTVESILNSAAELIDEVGVDGFNTNLLARRTGIRVRTVYRYFPNRHAVLAALVFHLYEESNESLDTLDELADPRRDWRAVVNHWLDQVVEWTVERPGAALIAGSMMGIPELMDIHVQKLEDDARKLAETLRARGVDRDDERLYALSRTMLEVQDTLVSLALEQKREQRPAILEEMRLMLIGHLANHLD
jgi:AcrR family transcriptional regulator